MEKASTFHSATTPPTDLSQDPPNPTHRKKRSHTVTLPRLPFHRHTRSNHSVSKPLASPTAPPSLPLPSLPFRKPHTHLHDGPSSSAKTSSPLPSRRPSISRPSTSVPAPLHDRLSPYPPNISLLPPSSLPITPSTLSQSTLLLSQASSATAASLASLNAKAHASTRRLDEVYYALLTRASALQDLVSRLRQLHSTMETGRAEFVAKAGEMEDASEEAVASWDGFGGREREVRGLVGRLEEARGRGRRVEERLVGLRERVEGVVGGSCWGIGVERGAGRV
ncbi:hypothetical protein BDZ85DRAFT_316637 [Elsinoe ampelina]|uniref:Uncharacterized protein n=1 Tax=Elsinoe ampelina TaxID=302913 RepID=A0A6A6GIN2_9PEZI|nr:hypothetical protein BDZ85DRAFT_316637 [Elsinoe ampelina]